MSAHTLGETSVPTQRQNVAVLLIDNDAHGKEVHSVLHEQKMDVCHVHDDAEALSAIGRISPDVIIANWDDESIDVNAIVGKLRGRRPSLQTIPTILLTALEIDTTIAFALNNAGFDVIVQKPVAKTLGPLVKKTAKKRKSWRRSSISFRLQGDSLGASASGCLFKGI